MKSTAHRKLAARGSLITRGTKKAPALPGLFRKWSLLRRSVHRPPREAIVDAGLHDMRLLFDVGQREAADRDEPQVLEVHEVVFDLGRPVGCEAVLEAGAHHPASAGLAGHEGRD